MNSNEQKPKVYCIVGPSGSGKTTIGEAVFGREKELTSFTTRPKRNGEIDGVDYYFISKEKISDMIKNSGLAEYTQYAGNYYGLTMEELFNKTAKYKQVYVIVNYDGYRQILDIYGRNVVKGIFIHMSKDDVEKGLKNRGDQKKDIESRLKQYDSDLEKMKHFDSVVYSKYGYLEQAIEDFKSFVK